MIGLLIQAGCLAVVWTLAASFPSPVSWVMLGIVLGVMLMTAVGVIAALLGKL